MDFTAIYELRTRLHAAAMSGTELLSEDYRLKRAVEAVRPLEKASPVFAKIGTFARNLLAPDCKNREGMLLEAISLIDAVLCTQGEVSVSGEVEELENVGCGEWNTNIPYSVVHGLLDAMQNSGSGRYSYAVDMHNNQPEVFKDYRVKEAMVKGLGASYAELAEEVASWLKECGEEIVPLLKHGFDKNGKREMVRRVQVLESICKEKENDFYLSQIPDSEKAVREALIFALRHSEKNIDTLIEFTRTQKASCKKKALWALSNFGAPKAEQFFMEFVQKKPVEALYYLVLKEDNWVSQTVAKGLRELLLPWVNPEQNQVLTRKNADELEAYLGVLMGKTGSDICECYKIAASIGKNLNRPVENQKDIWDFRCFAEKEYGDWGDFETAIGVILHRSLLYCQSKELADLAIELYEKYGKVYFAAALTAKLLENAEEGCCKWLEEQLWSKNLLEKKLNRELLSYLQDAVSYIIWDKGLNSYAFTMSTVNPATNENVVRVTAIRECMEADFTELLIKASSSFSGFDSHMIRWLVTKDTKTCHKLEQYYYKKALTIKNNPSYLGYLRHCNSKRCEGLAVHHFSQQGHIAYWEFRAYFASLPGSVEDKQKEARQVCEMILDGRIKGYKNGIKPEDVETLVKKWSEATY